MIAPLVSLRASPLVASSTRNGCYDFGYASEGDRIRPLSVFDLEGISF